MWTTVLCTIYMYMNMMWTCFNRCLFTVEEDYRPWFESFVYDLLTTLNKLEWPASGLLLNLLGRHLVTQFSNTTVDARLRVTLLHYLGIIVSRVRNDAVTGKLSEQAITDIIKQVGLKVKFRVHVTGPCPTRIRTLSENRYTLHAFHTFLVQKGFTINMFIPKRYLNVEHLLKRRFFPPGN